MQLAGDGYAMLLLNSPAEGYTVSEDGRQPHFLQGNVLEWLVNEGVSWLMTAIISDLQRLRPDAEDHVMDLDFMAATLFAEDNHGANMAMEVSRNT